MKGKEDADQQSGEVIHPLRTEREYPVKILRKTFIRGKRQIQLAD